MTDGLVFDLEQREKDPELLWKGLHYRVWSRYDAGMIKIVSQALPFQGGHEGHEGPGGGHGDEDW